MKRILILFFIMILIFVSLPLQIFAVSTEEENSKVDDLTTLPYSDVINEDLSNLNTYEIQDIGTFAGNVYRYTVQESITLAANMIPVGSLSDIIDLECIIFVYLLSDPQAGTYELVSSYYDVAWDSPLIELLEPGEYYIFCCNSALTPATCTFNIMDVSTDTNLPDFRDQEIDLSGENDLWSWDSTLKTLTLQNGFKSYSFHDTAISLPSDSKIIVEGSCFMLCWADAIHSEGNVEIIVGQQAELSITTFSEYAIFTNNGNVSITGAGADQSIVNINSTHYGICVGEEGTMSFADCSMNVTGYESAIYNNNGKISINNSNLIIKDSLEGIINAYDADFVTVSSEYGVDIKSSVINIDVQGNAIKSFKGDLIFEDFVSHIKATTGRGIITQEASSLLLGRGTISIRSYSEALIINDGKVVLDDVAFSFFTIDDEKLCYVKDGIDYNGMVKITSCDDNTYVGVWNEMLMNGGNIVLYNENEEPVSADFITAYWAGNEENNIVSGINTDICYERDSYITFNTQVEEYALNYPNIGDMKWCAVYWQILDTDIYGDVCDSVNQIDASLLPGGKNIIRVAFQKQYYTDTGWAFAEDATEEDFFYVDNTIEVAMPVIDDTDTGDCCPGLFTILSFMIITAFCYVIKNNRVKEM